MSHLSPFGAASVNCDVGNTLIISQIGSKPSLKDAIGMPVSEKWQPLFVSVRTGYASVFVRRYTVLLIRGVGVVSIGTALASSEGSHDEIIAIS